ncbi:MAG: META domain-containing protein, partial [Nitrospirales bacterium]
MQWITGYVLERRNGRWGKIGLVLFAGLIASCIGVHIAVAQYDAEATLLLVRTSEENERRSTQNRTDTPASGLPETLPASFLGDLPCADCPGIRHRLDLFPDGIFFLRMIYLGRGEDAQYDDIGRWVVDGNGKRLVLHGGGEAPMLFTIEGTDRLRKLDLKGQPIESELNYELVRSLQATPLEPKLELRGMYHYMADAGLFSECLTGKKFPVALEKDNAALEAAYVRMRRYPNEEILVNLEGRIVQRPKVEGEGTQFRLVVHRFIGVWPGETCGARMTTASLEDMYWKLTRLSDQPVLIAPQQREPHLILHSPSRRIGGFGGCNRLIGGYELKDVRLTFGQVATTRMACREGMEMEAAFLAALEKVRTWKIAGQHLDLFD